MLSACGAVNIGDYSGGFHKDGMGIAITNSSGMKFFLADSEED